MAENNVFSLTTASVKMIFSTYAINTTELTGHSSLAWMEMEKDLLELEHTKNLHKRVIQQLILLFLIIL